MAQLFLMGRGNKANSETTSFNEHSANDNIINISKVDNINSANDDNITIPKQF